MRFPLSWLEDYVRVDVPIDDLVERLNLSGTKVEDVRAPSEDIEGVIVAEVVTVVPHPNADNLVLVEVSAGGGGAERVVCGVRNFAPGDRVPLATVGARLPDLVVSDRTIRGEPSRGMLCSAAELGVSQDHSGILVLPPDATVGADVVKLLGLDDTVVELEITPNRPDCMSMIGVAREVAALLRNELHLPAADLVPAEGVPAGLYVSIVDAEGCPRYVARVVGGVTLAASPAWLTTRLLAAGVRPISNVVDVTNYVMLETGQPLHAFDAARVVGGTIVVRRANLDEKLVTLDGVERSLHPDDLVIGDAAGAIAIAGVMGGAGSEVTDDTSAVVLESAHFSPASVALTARRHLLRTEASARFERGTDPNGASFAARRAAQLITELAGGKAARDDVDVYPDRIEPLRVALRPQRTDALLGISLDAARQTELLRSVGLDAAEEDDAGVVVHVPTFRPDITREADLIEEVGRLVGYEALPSTLPQGGAGRLEPAQVAERRLRWALSGAGLQEAWTPSFGSPSELDLLGLPDGHPARAMVELLNPTSAEEEPAMRTTLLPGLLRSVAHNLAHKSAEGVALYEIARVYEPTGESLPHERTTLGAVFCGARVRASWRRAQEPWDFFAAKGVLEATLEAMGFEAPQPERSDDMPWHPTRAASLSLGGARLGALGELHPDVCDRFDVLQGAVALEVDLEQLFAALPERPQVRELPRLPGVLIDVAVVVHERVPAAAVERTILSSGAPELADARLFDVYRGDQVPPGHKSLAYALELRSQDVTLTDEEAAAVRARIIAALELAHDARLRGS